MALLAVVLSILLSVDSFAYSRNSLASSSEYLENYTDLLSGKDRRIHLRKQQTGYAVSESFPQLSPDAILEAMLAHPHDKAELPHRLTPTERFQSIVRCLCILILMMGISALTYSCFIYPGISHLAPQEASKEKAIGFCFFSIFAQFFIFSSVIPDSLSWTLRIDADQAAFSGFLIGSWMATTVLGYILLTVMNRRQSNWSVVHMKSLNIFAGCISIAATFVFSFIAAHGEASVATLHFLSVARMLAGLGGGITLASTRVLVMKITSREDLVMCNARYTFFLVLGTGVGPLAATAVKVLVDLLVGHLFAYEVYSVYAITGMHVVMNVTLLYGIWEFPGDAEAMVVEGREMGTPRFQPSTWPTHRSIIYCCVFINTARAMAATGLESATAMILQNDFEWSQNLIGLVISISFLACIPLRMVHEQFKAVLSATAFLRINIGLAFVGCLLFFESVSSWIAPGNPQYGRLVCLLVGDCFLFPSLQYLGGMIEGTANSHCLPEGSYFTITDVILYCKVPSNCLGYTLGPFVARWLLDHGRQDWYAWMQILITISCIVVLEIGVFQQEDRLQVLKEKESEASGSLK